jgi:hypothetical protein
MLSKNAFLCGLALSTGAMTVHDLRRTLGFQDLPSEERSKAVLEGLAELCRRKLIMWWLEPDYGNSPPQKPTDFGESTFLIYWRDYMTKSDLSVEVPNRDNPTIFLEGVPDLRNEIDKECYDSWKKMIGW